MLTVGVDIAKMTLEAAAWQEGRALRRGTFEQTAAGWIALRDAVAALQVPPTGPDQEPVAIILEPTGGYELAGALWARQQDGGQVQRPHAARGRAWARSQGWRAKAPKPIGTMRCCWHVSVSAPSPRCRREQPLASEFSEWEQLRRRRDDGTDWLQRERRRDEQLGVRPAASTTVHAS